MKKLLLILCCTILLHSLHAQVLYGTTYNGGAVGKGTIVKFTPATNSITAAFTFENTDGTNPRSATLIQAVNGKLYGITTAGGSNGNGTIYSYAPSTSTYTKLYDFDGTNGNAPYGSLVQATNGKLYGMTNNGGAGRGGVIFSFDPATNTFAKLKDLDDANGDYPYGGLMQASNGKLYGMTCYGGTAGYGVIFSFDPATATYTKLKEFTNTDGAYPYGNLMQATNGKLYGMTNKGGNTNNGVIFSFDPATAAYTKLKEFDGTNGGSPYGSLMQATNGKLYGMTYFGGQGYGVIFSLDPATATYTRVKDFDNTGGAYPYGSLMQAANGKLYGLTLNGGSSNYGVIFSFSPSNAVYSKLTEFDGITGAGASGGLMQATDGKLYGVTATTINNYGNGVLFSYNTSSFAYTKIRDFGTNTTGALLYGGLAKSTSGLLYGMTYNGGSNGFGVLFSFSPATGTYTKLKDFDNFNGAFPTGAPMQAANGKLYGVTKLGGGSGNGILFSYDPVTATYSKLKDFNMSDGSQPQGGLVQASNGKLYGMTYQGGSAGSNGGTIFSYDPATNIFIRIIDLDNTTGRAPNASMIQASNGKLYGMTASGGKGYGTLFSLDPATNTFTKLYEFVDSTGSTPYGNLIQAKDGKFYGLTYAGGANHAGVIFSFDPVTSVYTKLKDLHYTIGTNPYGSLVQASNGKLYAMGTYGQIYNTGTVFSYDVATAALTKINDFDGTNGRIPFNTFFVEMPGSTTYFKDTDGDGDGSAKDSVKEYTQPAGYVTNKTDCNDTDKTIYPGAPELCDGKDNNCDGTTDEGCSVPQLKVNDVTKAEGNSGQSSITFTVTLTQTATKTVSVNYKTVNKTAIAPGDFIAQTGTLSFAAGTTKKTIAVLINGDTQVETDEKFQVILSNPVNATITDSIGVGTIRNDDTIAVAATLMVQENSNTPSITVAPNPATTGMNVQLKGYSGNIVVQLMDMQGKVLKEAKLQTNSVKYAQQQFDITTIAGGTYFIVASDAAGNKQSVQISIVH